MPQIPTTALFPNITTDATGITIPYSDLEGLTQADVEGPDSDARYLAYGLDRTMAEKYNALAAEVKGSPQMLQSNNPNLNSASHSFSRTYSMTIGNKPRVE